MTHKKLVVAATVLALASTPVLGNTAHAHDDHKHEQRPAMLLNEKQHQLVEERKATLRQKLETAKETRQNKLEGKRLEVCEKRAGKINNILANGTDKNRKHLAVFQKIEERVKQFYLDKNLSAEGYDAAVANADAKEAAVVAALETATETTFDCANADGGKPGEAIRELMKSRHQALKDYRTAIKDLILVVKKSQGTQQTQEPTTNEGEQ